jgi:hypothetical protein
MSFGGMGPKPRPNREKNASHGALGGAGGGRGGGAARARRRISIVYAANSPTKITPTMIAAMGRP